MKNGAKKEWKQFAVVFIIVCVYAGIFASIPFSSSAEMVVAKLGFILLSIFAPVIYYLFFK